MDLKTYVGLLILDAAETIENYTVREMAYVHLGRELTSSEFDQVQDLLEEARDSLACDWVW